MHKKNLIIISIVILVISVIIFALVENSPSGNLVYNPPTNGIVPDEATAIKLAEIIGVPIFGGNLKDYKPFYAELKNDSIWYVYGRPKKMWFVVQYGGCPEFQIQKADGKVLKVNISR